MLFFSWEIKKYETVVYPHLQQVPSGLGRCYIYHHHRVVDMTSRPNAQPSYPLLAARCYPTYVCGRRLLSRYGWLPHEWVFPFHVKRSSVLHSSKPWLRVFPTCTNCVVRVYGGLRGDPFFLQSVPGVSHFGLIRQHQCCIVAGAKALPSPCCMCFKRHNWVA